MFLRSEMTNTEFDMESDIIKPLVFFLGMHELLPDLPKVPRSTGFFDDEDEPMNIQNEFKSQYFNNFN